VLDDLVHKRRDAKTAKQFFEIGSWVFDMGHVPS
jgi:hypothetical protein